MLYYNKIYYGVVIMVINYKKLWHLLLDKNMNKTELQKKAGITWAAMSKLTKNEHVNTEILAKICFTLNCQLNDIAELVNAEKDED